MRLLLQNDVGGGDEQTAADEGEGPCFVGDRMADPPAHDRGQEHRHRRCEQWFGAIDQPGFDGMNVGLPMVHHAIGDDAAKNCQCRDESQRRRR